MIKEKVKLQFGNKDHIKLVKTIERREEYKEIEDCDECGGTGECGCGGVCPLCEGCEECDGTGKDYAKLQKFKDRYGYFRIPDEIKGRK